MPHPVDIAVGGRIKEHRIRKGLSQEELGSKVGVSFQQIQKYEKGLNRLGASRVVQLCEALDIPISAAFEGIETVKDATKENLINTEAAKVAREWLNIPSPELRASVRNLMKHMGPEKPKQKN